MQKQLKLALGIFIFPFAAFANTATVQVEETPIRNTPQFFGEVVDTVNYGDSVDILEERGAWDKVKGKKKSGWLHQSAITSQKTELSAGKDVSSSASGKDIALAAKGFGEVEAKYQSSHHLNFDWINKMEKFAVKTSEVKQFIKDGNLQGAEQ